MDVDFIKLCRFVGDEAKAVRHSFISFFLLRTEALISAAEDGDNQSRRRLAAAHIALVLIGYLAAFWFLSGEAAPPIGFTIRASLLGSFASVVLSVPVWLALRFVARRPNAFFLINLVSIVQTLFVVLFFTSNLILMVAEPARTDFSLIRAGLGHDTLAYKAICGIVENDAELMVRNRQALARNEAALQDNRTLLGFNSQRFPAVGDELLRQETEVRAQSARRLADFNATVADVRRLVEIAAEEERNSREIWKRYPLLLPAAVLVLAGLFISYALAAIHIWKAGVWHARGWPRKLAVAGSLILAGAAAVGMVGLFIMLSTPPPVELPGDRLLASNPRTLEEMEVALDDLEQATLLARQAQEIATARLQARFHDMKYVCPSLDSRGLWSDAPSAQEK